MKIPTRQSESANLRRTDNTMVKRKRTQGQTTIYKTLHIKLKIEYPQFISGIHKFSVAFWNRSDMVVFFLYFILFYYTLIKCLLNYFNTCSLVSFYPLSFKFQILVLSQNTFVHWFDHVKIYGTEMCMSIWIIDSFWTVVTLYVIQILFGDFYESILLW